MDEFGLGWGGTNAWMPIMPLAPEVTILTPLAPHSGRRKLSKGSMGRTFAVVARTGGSDRAGFCPSVRRRISVLPEPTLGHLRCPLTDVPPQPNSPPDTVPGPFALSVTLEMQRQRSTGWVKKRPERWYFTGDRHDERRVGLPPILHLKRCLLTESD